MKSTLLLLFWALATQLLSAQSGFAKSYLETAGFEGTHLANTTYGYKIFANNTTTLPNTISRMTLETGADGTFWGITSNTDYPQPAGTLTDVSTSGDYATAETFATPNGISLRLRRWFPAFPGYFNNLAEINFPDVAQLTLERLVFRDNFPGGAFLAGYYRTNAEPSRPVPFLVRSSNSTFEWWIQYLDDIPPTTFAFIRLTPSSDGGCAVVFKKTDERVFIERFNAAGASLWRREVGFLDNVTSLTEGPSGQTWYTVEAPPFSGPLPTYGIVTAIAPDGTVVFEKNMNVLLGQFSVLPRYMLPLATGGFVIAGFEVPVLGAGRRFFIAKMDPTGQVLWKRNYFFFQNGATFTTAFMTADNGLIFTGSTEGNVFLFKVGPNGVGAAIVQYCPAQAGQPWYEWISGVQIGQVQHTSGKSHYSDFTALSADLGIGQPVNISITAAFSYFTYHPYLGVWIDYNQNNVFESNEMAVQAALPRPADGTPFQVFDSTFTIPPDALPGATRMRMILQRDDYPSPCTSPVFGEVEDYTVNLKTLEPAPDLRTPAWELIPANHACFTNPGQSFEYLAGLILNTGSKGAGHFTAKAWLSADSLLGNEDDQLWQVVHYDTIAPSGAQGNPLSLSISDPVPLMIAAGRYHFFVKVDADNTLAELDETNNLFTGLIQIGAPDYLVQNLMTQPNSVPTGGALNVTFELNHSNIFPLADQPGGVEVFVYLSPDDLPGNGNDLLLGSQTIPFDAFNAMGVVAKNWWLPLPGTVTAGSYYTIIQVAPSAFCDQNDQNNVLVGPPIQVTGPPSSGYCAAQGFFPWHDWIGGVSVANLINSSGKSPYSDFSAFTADLVQGTSVPVALTTGFSWQAFDEYWKIWIDFDHNGILEEPGEIAFQEYAPKPEDGTPGTTFFGSMTVPNSTLTGTTKMRVAMKRGGTPGPSPCESFAFGEVEDYSVHISPSFQISEPRATVPTSSGLLRFDIYPNPTNGKAFLNIPDDVSVVSLSIVDQNGQTTRKTRFEQSISQVLEIDLSLLPSGIYWLQIIFNNGMVACKKLVVAH